MSYNDKKFLDVNGLKHLISILDDYPTNEVLGTVINAIESEIPTNVSQLQNDAGYLTTHQDISGKANNADLAAVATSGSYNDLSNKPTIPDIQIEGYSIVENGVANIPHGSDSQLGVIRTDARYGIAGSSSGVPQLSKASSLKIKEGTDEYRPIVPENQHESAFYGLAKAAGYDEKNSTEATGIYTDGAKAAIQNMLGITDLISTEETTTATAAHALNSLFLMGGKLYKATTAIAIGDAVEVGTNCEVVKVEDVFVKNTDKGSYSKIGLVKAHGSYGVGIWESDGALKIDKAPEENVKKGTGDYKPLVPTQTNLITFYGLSKAAGVDLANEEVTLGTYTETAKFAIRNMLGAASTNIVAVQDEQPTDTDTKVWLPGTQATGVQVPTMEDLGDYVQKTDYATTDDYGLVKVGSGLYIGASTGKLAVAYANSSSIKNGTNATASAPVSLQHESTFYGLAKAAGADLASAENVTVGTYPTTASAAIRSMLGAVGTTDYAGHDTAGVVKVKNTFTYGLYINDDGTLRTNPATIANCKAGNGVYVPIANNNQHAATFYGLAKVAGADEKDSTLPLGTYSQAAKTAIQSMLGVENGVSFVENMTGSTIDITGEPNTRYMCEEVSVLTITPPANGVMDIVFSSGTTPTVLTLPSNSTIKWPSWFDPTSLEAEVTYEINIMDNTYGAVMVW